MNSKSKFLPWIVTAAVLVVAIVATTVTGVTMKNNGYSAGRAAGYSAGYAEGLAAANPAQAAFADENDPNAAGGATGLDLFPAEETTEAPPSTASVEIKITFDAVGGTATETERSLITGELYGELPEAEKPSQELAGWYTAKDGGDKITPETILEAEGDVTVYAHWIEKEKVKLIDLDYFSNTSSSTYAWEKGSVQDNEGVQHGAWTRRRLGSLAHTGTIVFLLDCKYTSLEGQLFVQYGSRNNLDEQVVVKIYCDNKLVYTSPTLSGGVRPISFKVNTTNVEQLKIEAKHVSNTAPAIGLDAELAPI